MGGHVTNTTKFSYLVVLESGASTGAQADTLDAAVSYAYTYALRWHNGRVAGLEVAEYCATCDGAGQQPKRDSRGRPRPYAYRPCRACKARGQWTVLAWGDL